MQPPKIGIDLMGGDLPTKQLADQIYSQLTKWSNIARFVLLGTSDVLSTYQKTESIHLVIAEQEVLMLDPPLKASKDKKNSSMSVGLDLLKNGHIDAFITLGNTGALTAMTRSQIARHQRASLLAVIPTKKNSVAVLDVGANVESRPEHLTQFAKMGIAYQKCHGINHPRVALLNIGKEPYKGTRLLRATYQLLQKENFFIGNIESHQVLEGSCDVLITSGFAGNLFIKTCEAMKHFLLGQSKHLSYFEGAVLCGVKGLIIKCHGNSNAAQLLEGVNEAARLINENFLEKVEKEL